MKKIVIITTGYFPEGDAGANRLRMMAKALMLKGYAVTVLCRGKLNDRGSFDGAEFISLRNRSGGKLSRALEYLTFPSRAKSYLMKNEKDIYGVYIYNAHISVFEFCKKFASKYGKKLVHDCVEWYSPEGFKRGERDLAYIEKNKINTKIVDKSFSVIAISSYLDRAFSSRGIKTAVVPVLCDASQRLEPKKQNAEKLTLFYAGAPQRKDFIGNLFKASLLLDENERERLRIIVVGVSRESLIANSDIPSEVIDACSGYLELTGRVDRARVLEMMEEADFTMLPRDAEARYAMAGFPSKVTESLANATPIFCNLSSDLALYLKDGENAVIARDHSPEALAEALRRAILLAPEEKNEMSRKALESARDKLDYHIFADTLKKIIEA